MAAEGYKTLKFKPGQTIFSEGDEGDCAYIVQSGTVKVIKAGSTGKEVVIAKVTKGGIIGEMAVVEQAPRFATVKAVDDVKLMVVSRESFLKRLSGLDRFTNVLLQTLIGRLKTQSQKTVELAVRHAEQITKAGGGPKPAVTLGGQHGQREYDFTGVEMILVDHNQPTRAGVKVACSNTVFEAFSTSIPWKPRLANFKASSLIFWSSTPATTRPRRRG